MKDLAKTLSLLILLSPMSAMAHGDAASPTQTVASFHEALAAGDRSAALELLDPEATIFESGGAELSRDEYASHHLDSDMEFSAAIKRTIVDRVESAPGDVAWVLTRSETRGTFRGKQVDSLGVETVVLKRGSHGWRIVHIHWSSRSRAASH